MLGLNQTFDDTRTIKVLVVPIGENSLFDSHFHIVSRRRIVPMYDLNRPSDWKKSGFKFFDWSIGNLRFEYLRYDRVPHGPGSFDNYQSSRRVLMVMGLINYPELGKMAGKIKEELDYYSRRHTNVVLRRIFVFNYSFDKVSLQPLRQSGDTDEVACLMESADPHSVIIFPPEGMCEGGSMIEVHLQEVMGNAGVMIISSLEQQMAICEEGRIKNQVPQGLVLSTLYDEYDAKEENSKLKQAIKKKPSGRIRKWMGDLSLQVCSPIDAVEHYAAAILDCRALSDQLWLAGALEGYSASILLLLKLKIPVEEIVGKDLKQVSVSASLTDPSRVLRLAEERYGEALVIYSKHVVYCGLEVECTLRLARMFEEFAVVDRHQKVLEYVLRSAAVPGLNAMQQIECVLEGAIICRRMQLHRKYALLLYIAALMSAESDHTSMAHALIRKACFQYGVNISPAYEIDSSCVQIFPTDATEYRLLLDRIDEFAGSATSEFKASDMEVTKAHASWISMRRAVFVQTAHVAKECGDVVSATRSISALLRLMSDLERRNDEYQHYWVVLSEGITNILGPSPTGSQQLLSEEALRSLQSLTGSNGGSRATSTASFSMSSDFAGAAGGLSSPRSFTNSTHGAVATTIGNDGRRGSGSVFNAPGMLGGINSSMSISHSQQLQHQSKHPFGLAADVLMASINANDLEDAAKSVVSEVFKEGLRKISVPMIPSRLTDIVKLGKDALTGPPIHYQGNMDPMLSNQRKTSHSILSPMKKGINSARRTLHPTALKQLARDISNSTMMAPGTNSGPSLFLSEANGSSKSSGSNNSITSSDFKDADYLASLSSLLDRLIIPRDQEEQAMVMLNVLSRDIIPETLTVLPAYVVSAKPLLVPGTMQPVRISACSALDIANAAYPVIGNNSVSSPTANVKSSAFFYDPFAAHKNSMSPARPAEVLWTVDTRCRLQVILSNPLSVALQIDNLFVVMVGVPHKIYPCSVMIPPRSAAFEVELFVKPFQVGELKIIGVKLFVNNAMQVITVDESGCPIIKRKEIYSPGEYPRKVKTPPVVPLHVDAMDQNVLHAVSTNTILVVSAAPTMHSYFREIRDENCGGHGVGTNSAGNSLSLSTNVSTSSKKANMYRSSSHGSNASVAGVGPANKFLMSMDSSIVALYGYDPKILPTNNVVKDPLTGISSSNHHLQSTTINGGGNLANVPMRKSTFHLFEGENRSETIVLKKSSWENTQKGETASKICDVRIKLTQWCKVASNTPKASSGKSTSTGKSTHVLFDFCGPLAVNDALAKKTQDSGVLSSNSNLGSSAVPCCQVKAIRCKRSFYEDAYRNSSGVDGLLPLLILVDDQRNPYGFNSCEGDMEIDFEFSHIAHLDRFQIDIEIVPDNKITGNIHGNDIGTLFAALKSLSESKPLQLERTRPFALFSRIISIGLDVQQSPAIEILSEGVVHHSLQCSQTSQQSLISALKGVIPSAQHCAEFLVVRPIVSAPTRLFKIANRTHLPIRLTPSSVLTSGNSISLAPLGVSSLMIAAGSSHTMKEPPDAVHPHIWLHSNSIESSDVCSGGVGLRWEMIKPTNNERNRFGTFHMKKNLSTAAHSKGASKTQFTSTRSNIHQDVVSDNFEQLRCPLNVRVQLFSLDGAAVNHRIVSLNTNVFYELVMEFSISCSVDIDCTSSGDCGTSDGKIRPNLSFDATVVVTERQSDQCAAVGMQTTTTTSKVRGFLPSNVVFNGNLTTSQELLVQKCGTRQIASHKLKLCFLQPGAYELFGCVCIKPPPVNPLPTIGSDSKKMVWWTPMEPLVVHVTSRS